MDCKNARLLLSFAHPAGELDTADRAALQQHLHECPCCGELAQSEDHFDKAIGKAMLAIEPPEGLRMRLLAKLDADRDSWYRRFGLRTAAAAAAILLVLLGGWLWVRSWRYSLDIAKVEKTVETRYQANFDRVDAWLKEVGGNHLSAPRRFNYANLQWYGQVNLEGYQVPALLFGRKDRGEGAAFAIVYVLGDDRFDLKSTEGKWRPISGVRARMHVLEDVNNPHVLYLIGYTGNQLEEFYKAEAAPLR